LRGALSDNAQWQQVEASTLSSKLWREIAAREIHPSCAVAARVSLFIESKGTLAILVGILGIGHKVAPRRIRLKAIN
jgi:hypothetical protein